MERSTATPASVVLWVLLVVGFLYALVSHNDLLFVVVAFLGVALLSRRYVRN